MSWNTLVPEDDQTSVHFEDLTYKINDKIILNKISGHYDAGELIAIIGPSGSGKTTLLNILAGYKCQDFSGTILINGAPRNEKIFRKISRYIMQDSVFSQKLTVQEILTITVKLKLAYYSSDDRMKTIKTILDILNFDCNTQTCVDKLSSGEKKRLSIGLELINNPSLLFLDEPTTGLDYYSCSRCIYLLRDLANTGRTVICSLHTPTAQMMSIFDQVYVINAGQCAYQGKSEDIVPHLASIDLICPTHYDPMDFITELCNGDYGDYQDRLISSVNNGKITVNKVLSKDCKPNYNTNLGDNFKYGANWMDQFLILLARMWLQTWRNKTLAILKFVCLISVAIAIGILYSNKGNDGSYSFQIYLSFFICVEFIVFYWGVTALPQFTEDYKSFKREHFNGWYSLSAFYCALSVSTIHFHILYGIIFVTILHSLIGFPMEFHSLSIAIVIYILTGLIAESLAQIVATVFKLLHGLHIYIISLVMMDIFVFQEGYYLYGKPLWYMILSCFNFIWFSFKGITSIMFENRKHLHCSDICLFSDLDKFLNDFGTGSLNWSIAISVLMLIFVLVKIGGFYVLKIKTSKGVFFRKIVPI